MKFFAAAILFLGIVTFGHAQTVTGRLVNQVGNGMPGMNLKLYVNSRVYSATSWHEGSFAFYLSGEGDEVIPGGGSLTDVRDDLLPAGYSVSNNYPNPFNPKTRFIITLAKGGAVSAEVFNILGERVLDEPERHLGAGASLIDLELNGLPNGSYFARILLDGKYTVVKKILLLYGSMHVPSSNDGPTPQPEKRTIGDRLVVDQSIDSLVVMGATTGRTVFTNLPPITGSSVYLGRLLVRMPAPFTEIVDGPTDTVLVLNNFTDDFRGIAFTFQASDPNSRTMEYSYSVDSLGWSAFNPSNSVRITAAQFRDPYAIRHTFSVRSKNEFGEVDTLGYFFRPDTAQPTGFDTIYACRVFYSIFPTFLRPGGTRQILVINKSYRWETDRYPRSTPAYPTSTMVEDYYRGLFTAMGRTQYTIVTPANRKFPGKALLAAFSTVVIVADVMKTSGYLDSLGSVLGSATQRLIEEYCSVGGNLVTSSINLPAVYNTLQGDFFSQVFHARPLDYGEISLMCPQRRSFSNSTIWDSAFSRAKGTGGYPNVDIDPTKLDTAWHSRQWSDTSGVLPLNHGLFDIWILRPSGFGESIYGYNSQYGIQCFENSNIGVRYQGPSFNSIFLGFPLYYMKADQAAAALKKALHDCGE